MVVHSLNLAVSKGFIKLSAAKDFLLLRHLPDSFKYDDNCILLTVHKAFTYQGKEYKSGDIVLHFLDSQDIQKIQWVKRG